MTVYPKEGKNCLQHKQLQFSVRASVLIVGELHQKKNDKFQTEAEKSFRTGEKKLQKCNQPTLEWVACKHAVYVRLYECVVCVCVCVCVFGFCEIIFRNMSAHSAARVV